MTFLSKPPASPTGFGKVSGPILTTQPVIFDFVEVLDCTVEKLEPRQNSRIISWLFFRIFAKQQWANKRFVKMTEDLSETL